MAFNFTTNLNWSAFREDSSEFSFVFEHDRDFGDLVESCEKTAFVARCLAVYTMTCGALGHPGGSFSDSDFLAVLYNYLLRYRAREPRWEKRDVFYLSKCHACPSLYAILSMFGFFDPSHLKTYGTFGSILESHPDMHKTPGIEISGGSLGQIPGVAVGRALAMKQKGPDHYGRMVYTLIGDGECDEGSVWEAFMSASQYGLDNLVFVIDYNKVQAKGFICDDMGLEPLKDKLEAFGLDVYTVRNGHDVAEIITTFNSLLSCRRGKSSVVVLNTVKGYPIETCTLNPNWHTSAPRSIAMAQDWLEELWRKQGRKLGISHDFVDGLVSDMVVAAPLHACIDKFEDKQA
jgi:transketolase